MVEIWIRFIGAGLWYDSDDFPFAVPVPRVPIVGEVIKMPDDGERWSVSEVVFDYAGGLVSAPTVRVACVPRYGSFAESERSENNDER